MDLSAGEIHFFRDFITAHYRRVLDRVFGDTFNFTHVILFEDDFLFAPDLVRYFQSTWWLLDADPSLFCISAWNDNGFERFANDGERLMRTDIFPGLGWMMKKSLWTKELAYKWPDSASTGALFVPSRLTSTSQTRRGLTLFPYFVFGGDGLWHRLGSLATTPTTSERPGMYHP